MAGLTHAGAVPTEREESAAAGATPSTSSSSVDAHAVPPFYACYLLRSYATPSATRTYIGSTPDPARRKKQHNGLLSQGAHKTKRGRPWETQMLVYGFPSKIAALQFEWAWQKPHLSRHLRTHPQSEDGSARAGPSRSDAGPPSSSQQQHIPLPLFTDTPLNQVAVSADGCKPLPYNSVQTSLFVVRALLCSEPFAGWGLRIAFFEEYLWIAWAYLNRALVSSMLAEEELQRAGLQPLVSQSRLGRKLPPPWLSPSVVCDFSGVDGARKSLLQMSSDERRALKIEASTSAESGARKATAKGKVSGLGRTPGLWPERLPRSLTVRSLGGTWEMVEQAMQPPRPIADRSRRRRDVTAAETEQSLSASSNNALPARLQLDDEDEAEAAWRRFSVFMESRNLSVNDVCPQERRTSASPAPQAKCSACRGAINLAQHTAFSTCPSPMAEVYPYSNAEPSVMNDPLARFGFTRGDKKAASAPESGPPRTTSSCNSVFHVKCLAKVFLAQQSQTGHHLLPTHGACPCCLQEANPFEVVAENTWNAVIRAVFRRRDRVLRELALLEVARLKAARVATQQAKKKNASSKTRIANKRGNVAVPSPGVKEANAEAALAAAEMTCAESREEVAGFDPTATEPTIPRRAGLLGALDEVDGRQSQAAFLAAKRTVPPTWTPQPLRNAPSERVNVELGQAQDSRSTLRQGDAAGTAAVKPHSSSQVLPLPSYILRQTDTSTSTGSAPPRVAPAGPRQCEVIDLT